MKRGGHIDTQRVYTSIGRNLFANKRHEMSRDRNVGMSKFFSLVNRIRNANVSGKENRRSLFSQIKGACRQLKGDF